MHQKSFEFHTTHFWQFSEQAVLNSGQYSASCP